MRGLVLPCCICARPFSRSLVSLLSGDSDGDTGASDVVSASSNLLADGMGSSAVSAVPESSLLTLLVPFAPILPSRLRSAGTPFPMASAVPFCIAGADGDGGVQRVCATGICTSCGDVLAACSTAVENGLIAAAALDAVPAGDNMRDDPGRIGVCEFRCTTSSLCRLSRSAIAACKAAALCALSRFSSAAARVAAALASCNSRCKLSMSFLRLAVSVDIARACSCAELADARSCCSWTRSSSTCCACFALSAACCASN
mmetsp:Transcript_1552/g.4591  ORF Transcript_1552/g.4591 Transcript_1552/m.4591 type:complete len:258 (+) Transcript_1552:516-1289(+)